MLSRALVIYTFSFLKFTFFETFIFTNGIFICYNLHNPQSNFPPPIPTEYRK